MRRIETCGSALALAAEITIVSCAAAIKAGGRDYQGTTSHIAGCRRNAEFWELVAESRAARESL